MKKILVLTFVLFSGLLLAQRPNRGGGQRNINLEQTKIPKFDAAKRAGIFYYDIKEVLKKIKADSLNDKISTALKKYNDKVKEISFLNSKKLNDITTIINSIPRGNVGNGIEIRKKASEVIRPIRNKINNNEKHLNETLKGLLSEKQNEKWLKYQSKKKKNLVPQRPNRRNKTNSRQRRGGTRRQ